MKRWYDKYLIYADKVLKKDKNDKHKSLYESYNDIHKPYTFSVYPERKELKPFRPFKYKVPGRMDFVDDVGLMFRYDKRDGKLHYLCTTLSYPVILEADLFNSK